MLQPEIRCVELVEQLTEWLEGGLSDEERLLFEEHPAYCSPCERYAEQFRQTLTIARSNDSRLGEGPPLAVRSALLEAFRHRHR